MVKIGIIGGSGLDNPDILKDARDVEVDTSYGKPTSPLKMGKINEARQVLDYWIKRSKQEYVSSYNLARFYFALGENDQGFIWAYVCNKVSV